MSIRSVYTCVIYTTTAGQTIKTYVIAAVPTSGHTAEDNAIQQAFFLYNDVNAYAISTSYQGDAALLIENTGILTDVDKETGGLGGSYFYRVTTKRPDNSFASGSVIAKSFEDASFSAYNSGTTYAIGDKVNDGGISYISIRATNVGHTPASTLGNWWQTYNIPAVVIAMNAGLDAVAPLWSSATTYAASNLVIDTIDGQCYQSLVGSNINHQPSTSGTQWVLVAMPVAYSAELLGNQALS